MIYHRISGQANSTSRKQKWKEKTQKIDLGLGEYYFVFKFYCLENRVGNEIYKKIY